MVRYLASRKARELPSHCELDDLVSSGTLALLSAVELFDPAKGSTFEQYAWARVSGAFVDELRRQDWAPRSVRRFARDAERIRDRWFARTGALPSEGELASELGLDPVEYRSRLRDLDRAAVTSLNAPIRETSDGVLTEVGETIEGSPLANPETTVLGSERSHALREAIADLSKREQRVLQLVHVDNVSGAEAGRELGVSESRISQILSSVRSKLRDHLDQYDQTDGDRAVA